MPRRLDQRARALAETTYSYDAYLARTRQACEALGPMASPATAVKGRRVSERASRDHYSYTIYNDPDTARTFDDRRFGGPIGDLIATTQAAVLVNFVGSIPNRTVLDVGTGTGRAALLMALGGARVTGVDASKEMLAIARQRASEAGAAIAFRTGDAHALDFTDRSFEVVISLRMIMHTPRWNDCVAELCRVADQLVILDYPSSRSTALVQSRARRILAVFGTPHRALSGVLTRTDRGCARTCRIPDPIGPSAVRAADRAAQGDRFEALHRGRGGVARAHRPAAPLRIARDNRGRTVRALVTGATGFTGGHLARQLVRRGHAVRALVRNVDRAEALRAAGIELLAGDLRNRSALSAATREVDVVFHIAAVYRQAGVPDETYRSVNVVAVRDLIEAAAANGVRRVVHCSTVGVHGDIEHPPATEDAPLRPGDIYQVTKLEGERLARESGERSGVEVVGRTAEWDIRTR